MRRYRILGTVLLASSLGMPAFADARGAYEPIEAVRQALAKDDCAKALSLGRTTRDTTHPIGKDSAWLNSVIVFCEAKTGGETAKMYAEAMTATASEPSSDYVWITRLRYEAAQKQFAAAVLTVETMAQTHPAALNDVRTDGFFGLYQRMREADDETDMFRLLKVLNTSYKPTQPFADTEGLRLLYARKLYDRGDRKEASEIVNGIQSFGGLRQISADRDLRALQDPRVDLSVAAERQYVEDGVTLSQHPESLEGVMRVAGDLRRLGRYQDALTELESARTRIGDPKIFADLDRRQAGWWEELAITYAELGNYDQVVRSYRSATALNEGNSPNISQVLDFELQQTRFGHYQDALATLATATDDPRQRSPYGSMVYHYAHGCAAKLAGHDKDAAADVAYVLAHEKDGAGNVISLLLCVGDLDGAAASVLRQLDNSEERSNVLDMLSTFRPEPATAPMAAWIKRLPELEARADVRAAVAKAGGTQTFPFPREDF